LDVDQVGFDGRPETASLRRADPFRDSPAAIDLDGVELAEGQEPLHLQAVEGVHALISTPPKPKSIEPPAAHVQRGLARSGLAFSMDGVFHCPAARLSSPGA
jgi:hypothetical protein